MGSKKVPSASSLIKKVRNTIEFQERTDSKEQKKRTRGQTRQDVREVCINDQFHPGEEKRNQGR